MPLDASSLPDLSRYARQMRYAPLGEEGQRRLAASRALICGCGALGSLLANTLVRAGVGTVRLVDRDFVELSNLHRQSLFDEADVAAGLPKAVAAAEKLRKINASVEIEPMVAHVGPENVEPLCEGMDVILDGTDNFETRYLLNDAAVHLNLPWVYGGCVGAEGQTMTIVPGETGCLRCLLPECPPPGSTPTCDTAGVLAPIVGVIASIQAQEAIKILSGNRSAISRQLTVIDLWQNRFLQLDVRNLRDRADCPACKQRQFIWLAGQQGSRAAVLCGRNAVQLTQPGPSVPLDALARRLEGVGRVTRNPFLLRLKVEEFEITLFPDGRAIIQGTDDTTVARTVYARYVGI
ncbi:MAG: ThiF family adenylyltransferase [Thermoguttaceae bacterium]